MICLTFSESDRYKQHLIVPQMSIRGRYAIEILRKYVKSSDLLDF